MHCWWMFRRHVWERTKRKVRHEWVTNYYTCRRCGWKRMEFVLYGEEI